MFLLLLSTSYITYLSKYDGSFKISSAMEERSSSKWKGQAANSPIIDQIRSPSPTSRWLFSSSLLTYPLPPCPPGQKKPSATMTVAVPTTLGAYPPSTYFTIDPPSQANPFIRVLAPHPRQISRPYKPELRGNFWWRLRRQCSISSHPNNMKVRQSYSSRLSAPWSIRRSLAEISPWYTADADAAVLWFGRGGVIRGNARADDGGGGEMSRMLEEWERGVCK